MRCIVGNLNRNIKIIGEDLDDFGGTLLIYTFTAFSETEEP